MKIAALTDFLPTIGMSWSKGQGVTPARFNRLLALGAASEHRDVINEVVLRTQAQAVYSPENIGHFGLNLSHYAHFTSPIRRYADLIVHRALIRAFGFGKDGLTDHEMGRLETISEHISTTERSSMAAEREATERYISGFLADRVGATFEGRITGVTRFGAFVKLTETSADGLIPISRIGAERFEHEEKEHALVSIASGVRYQLGQRVKVRLAEATPISGGLLFDMLSPPMPAPPGWRKTRRAAGPPQRSFRRGKR